MQKWKVGRDTQDFRALMQVQGQDTFKAGIFPAYLFRGKDDVVRFYGAVIEIVRV
jgi:hypothetical protein